MKKKVCFVVSSLINEGPVRVMLNIVKYIDFHKFDIFIITLKEEGKETLLSEFSAYPVSIYQLGIKSGIKNTPILFRQLKQRLKNIGPDIVHTHCPRSILLVSLMHFKFRKFHTVHNFPGLVDRVLYGFVKGTFVEYLMKWALKRVDHPISCGHNLKQQLQSSLGITSIAISNGVDFEVFSGDKELKIEAKELLGINPNKKCFVFVGRFSNEKNPMFLIRMFKSNEFKEAQLLMLGDGPLFEEAKSMACSNIKIVGFQKNVRDYLIAADFFVSTSVTEGMPNSVLEAMSIGLPLLLSDIPAHREIIEVSNKSIGFIFKLNDETDFIKSALLLLKGYSNGEGFCDVIDSYKSNFTAKEMSLSYQREYLFK
jgi:glycosyltransferase involved in cell wall biosynthesis